MIKALCAVLGICAAVLCLSNLDSGAPHFKIGFVRAAYAQRTSPCNDNCDGMAFGGGSIAGGGGCSQATSLIARMDGSQSTSAVTTLICGLVSDGTYSPLDGLYVFATNSTANATLNWSQNAFNLTWTSLANCTFSANSGITGDASTCFANTGFNPSTAGGQMAQNSASLGACILNNRTAANPDAEIGATDGLRFSYIQPFQGGGSFSYDLNGGSFPSFANSGTQGSWIVTRTSSAGLTLYLNGSPVATPTDASGSQPNANLFVLAFNNSGAGDFSRDKLAYVFMGGGLTSTQVGNVRSRLATYIAAVGGGGC